MVLVVATVALAATTPLSGYALNILMQAATYAIAVIGLTVVLGLCGQINLAQAAFFGMGAYAVGLGSRVDGGLNFWICSYRPRRSRWCSALRSAPPLCGSAAITSPW